MKKYFQILSCVLGGVMIGYFAGQLDSVVGCVCFCVGVALCAGSSISFTKKEQ